MALNISLPIGKKQNTKDLVFTILTKEYPLKIIELTNFIKKRYGKSVTFQAVRKAVLELVEESVLVKTGKEFSINKTWVQNARKKLGEIYEDLTKENKPSGLDSIQGEMSVFTFDSLNELMKFWQDIIDDWFENFKKGDPNINAYQGLRSWEALIHPDREKNVMGQLKKKGIISYAIGINHTPLDKYIWRFYKNVGLKVGFLSQQSNFDKHFFVATYGETIVQGHYPTKILLEMDAFFKKTKSIEDLDLTKLSDIVDKKVKVKLTAIKNLEMAKQINNSIISQIE